MSVTSLLLSFYTSLLGIRIFRWPAALLERVERFAKILPSCASEQIEALHFHYNEPPFAETGDMFGYLEEAVREDVDGHRRLQIRGWLFHRLAAPRRLSVRSDKGDIAILDWGTERRDLHEIFPWEANARRSGFSGFLYLSGDSAPEILKLSFHAELMNGEVIESSFARTI